MVNLRTSSALYLTQEQARELALGAGFAEAGLVALPYAAEARDARRFREWVGAGRAGTMRYLERKAAGGQLARERVAVPFPWARSALVCFANYLFPDAPLSTKTQERGSAWIARYAWTSRLMPSRNSERGERRPTDYHKVLLKRMRKVEAELHAQFGEFESRAYVDTGPVVERALAAAAGVGWIGKNTCVIHPKLGSFGFLAVLLTSLEASPKVQRAELPDRCGSCTRCIEACPTNALTAPYQMDATRCISYLTIEHKGPIAEELMEGMGRQVFGCDICQDVCPWNRKGAAQRADRQWTRSWSRARNSSTPRWSGWRKWTRRNSNGDSTDRRCAGRDSWASGATWPSPWATAGWHGLRPGWKRGRRQPTRACAPPRGGRWTSCIGMVRASNGHERDAAPIMRIIRVPQRAILEGAPSCIRNLRWNRGEHLTEKRIDTWPML